MARFRSTGLRQCTRVVRDKHKTKVLSRTYSSTMALGRQQVVGRNLNSGKFSAQRQNVLAQLANTDCADCASMFARLAVPDAGVGFSELAPAASLPGQPVWQDLGAGTAGPAVRIKPLQLVQHRIRRRLQPEYPPPCQ